MLSLKINYINSVVTEVIRYEVILLLYHTIS